MFPDYVAAHSSVASWPPQLAEYICLEAGWAAAAVLCFSDRLSSAGIGLGLGLAITEAGFLTADTADSFLYSNGDSPGHWLAIAALLAGVAGLLAIASGRDWDAPGARRGPGWAIAAGLALAALAVAAYFPNWDSGVVASSTGNAFSQPPGVTAGAVASAAAVAGVVVYTACWRATIAAASATIGATIALASQLVSGYVQVGQGVPQAQLVPGQRLALSGYWWADVVAAAGLATWAGWLVALERAKASPLGATLPAAHVGPPGAPEGSGEGESGEAGTDEAGTPEDWPPGHHWPRHHAHQER